MIDILGWGIALALVIATMLIHYEVILMTSDYVIPWAQRRFHNRRVMIMMMAALMLGHIVEIWVFAAAMLAMAHFPELGSLAGDFDGSLNSFGYFSAVNYTSLGYGDISPHGPIRSIAVSETLCGLLMIAWSASFTYLKMEQIWTLRRRGS